MSFRVLVVEDDDDLRPLLKEELEAGDPPVFTVVDCKDFTEGQAHVQNCHFDAVVLDLVEEATNSERAEFGKAVLDQLRKTRFLPVVFYTGYPERVQPSDERFVKILAKAQSNTADVRKAVIELLESDLVKVARLMSTALTDVLRRFYWETLKEATRPEGVTDHEIVHSTVRRVAWELSGERAAAMIGEVTGKEVTKSGVFAPQTFLWPPIDPPPGLPVWTGDIVRRGEGEPLEVVITAACDLAMDKAPNILLIEVISMELAVKERKKGNAAEIKRNTVAQYYYLPAAYGLSELCLDFSRMSHVTLEQGNALERVATLDEPWVHEVRARLQTYIGRVGTPSYAE